MVGGPPPGLRIQAKKWERERPGAWQAWGVALSSVQHMSPPSIDVGERLYIWHENISRTLQLFRLLICSYCAPFPFITA